MELKEYNKRVNEAVDIIIHAVGKNVSDYDEIEKQVVCAFTFGIINAFSLKEEMKAIQIQGTVISVLIDKFNYSVNLATQFCEFLIQCTNSEFHPTMNTIIHKGIDGYQYLDNVNVLKENILKMISIIKQSISS